MIVSSMIVNDAGDSASVIADGTLVEAAHWMNAQPTTVPVRKFSGTGSHACVRIRTLSGAEAVLSNNALVWPETGGFVLAQKVMELGLRIGTLVDGAQSWEPVVFTAPEPDMQEVVTLSSPGGIIAVGLTATHRIFTPERGNAPPSNRS